MTGRPTFKPTEKQRGEVKLFAAYGISHEDIAAQVGIDAKTLRKHFHTELKSGVTEANAKIAQRLFKKAMDGDTTAMIWWTKARAGWRETRREEITGADGGAIEVRSPMIFLPPVVDDAQPNEAGPAKPR